MSSERCPENYTAAYQYGYDLKVEDGRWTRTSDFGPHLWTFVKSTTHDLKKYGMNGISIVHEWYCNYCRKKNEVIEHVPLLRPDETPPPLDIPERT